MNLELEKLKLDNLKKLVENIEYRESVLRQLSYDKNRKSNFWQNFINMDLSLKKPLPPLDRFKDKINVHIDLDIELQNDIIVAFEKSKQRLEKEYYLETQT